MPKRKGTLALVEDEDEDFDLDDLEDDEEEDDALEDDLDEEDEDDDALEDDEEEDEDEDEEVAEAPKPKKRKGSKRSPVAPPSPVVEEDDEDFAQALGVPNEPSRTPALRNLTDDALVIELTDLIMQGDDSEMTSILVPMFQGPRGPKIAKKLVREARDRAIAKIKRVADVATVNIDTFNDDD